MTMRASNPASPISLLARERQSIWLDYMHRTMLKNGELKSLIEARGVRGATSNPTIFEAAIGKSDAYDDAIGQLAAKGTDRVGVYEALAIADIQAACDQFRPIFEMAEGNDGFVSMEVSPLLAGDTAGTIAEARRLHAAINRPNVMIKIPGTVQGVPAIRQCLADGININITLLFAVDMYEAVIGAYLAALEDRIAAKKDIATLRSVASFFVSRVDTETDKRLEKLNKPVQTAPLMGKAAVANAKIAYEKYTQHFEGPRFRALMAKGGAVQRPLWASTGTKNPKYPDTMYVDDLIGPDTVNTMPPATLEAFADHGTVARTVDQDVDQAHHQIAAIEALGITLKDVTDTLVEEGVKKFSESFDSLLKTIDEKKTKLAAV
ncbi:MAG TPA: transaldolase [Gemmatimonadales bacterium]|jgi:transaldolase